ncbi:hypothetical protein EYC84_001789 [Monilinia fructicola]|uniref:Initiation-specific alpha-1,6-mannosyltransferase n=1 Tax=Monilinia fructicola TaxID=38448 RepID=A0A5M9JQP5_MONFR|nr:hypothetical protein EYC84_001789 [Monilinia fructicola]
MVPSRVVPVACGLTFLMFVLWQLSSTKRFFNSKTIIFDPNKGFQQVVEESTKSEHLSPSLVYTNLTTTTTSTSTYIEVVTSTSYVIETISATPAPLFTPHPTPHDFPKKIWHKAGPKGVNAETMPWVQSWASKNPSYRQEILNDATADTYVLEHFSNHPEILYAYFTLTVPILRADLVRYLILLAEGGVWSDLDAECLVPVDNWIPHEFREAEINMVVGMEFDFGWKNDGVIHDQFNSWTLMAKPGTRHLEVIIKEALARIQKEAADHNVQLRDFEMSMISDVVDVTGPKAMTNAILKSLGEMLEENLDDRNISYTKMKKPTLLGDVLILPGGAMAAYQNGMPTDEGEYLVSHHYAGSWKNQDGGEVKKEG